MNLGQIFKLVDYLANKDQTGDTITPDQFSDVILPAINIMFFKKKYGLPEDYQPGQPLPRQAWQITKKISDDLRNFKVPQPAWLVDSNGRANIPSDYVHSSVISKTYIPYQGANPQTTEVEELTDSQAAARLSNSIVGPSIKNPFCVFFKTYIQFYPTNLQSVNFVYLRLPKTPFFDYIIVNDEYVFLPAGRFHNGSVLPPGTPSRTVELEWPEETHIDFTNRILEYVGINLREGDLLNYANNAKITGE